MPISVIYTAFIIVPQDVDAFIHAEPTRRQEWGQKLAHARAGSLKAGGHTAPTGERLEWAEYERRPRAEECERLLQEALEDMRLRLETDARKLCP